MVVTCNYKVISRTEGEPLAFLLGSGPSVRSDIHWHWLETAGSIVFWSVACSALAMLTIDGSDIGKFWFLLYWMTMVKKHEIAVVRASHAFKTSQSKFWKPSRCSSSKTILKSKIVHKQKPHSGRKKATCGSHFHRGRTLSEIWIIRTATRSIPRSSASSNWRRPVGCGWSWGRWMCWIYCILCLHLKSKKSSQTRGPCLYGKKFGTIKRIFKWSHYVSSRTPDHLAGCFMQGLRGLYYCYHYDLWNPWHTFTTRTKLIDWYQKTSGLEWDT